MLKALRAFALLFLVTGSLLLPQGARASHIVGTELSYQAVPGLPGYYLVSLKLYRDCGGITTNTSYPININSSCGTLPTLTVNLNQTTDVSGVCVGTPNECNSGSANAQPGVEEYIYTGLIDMSLAPPCSDWTFSYADCCRNGDIVNLSGAASGDFYTEAVLNTGAINNPIVNNTPVFSANINAAPYICNGDTLNYNPGAVDLDGDSLVYSLAPALGGTAPNPVTLPYNASFSPVLPFGTNPGYPTTINASTGEIRYVAPILPPLPVQSQSYVVVIRIDEYREINGVQTLVGTSQRDVQVQVLRCTSPPPTPLPVETSSGFVFTPNDTIDVRACQCTVVEIPFRVNDSLISLTEITSNKDVLFPDATEQVIQTTVGATKIYTYVLTWCAGPEDLDPNLNPYQLVLQGKNDVCPVPSPFYATRLIRITQAALETRVEPDTVCLGQVATVFSALDSSVDDTNYTYKWRIVPPKGKSEWTPADAATLENLTRSIFIGSDTSKETTVQINQSALDAAGYGQVTELKLIATASPDSLNNMGCPASDTLTIPIALPLTPSFYYYEQSLDLAKDEIQSGPPVKVFFRNTSDPNRTDSLVWTIGSGMFPFQTSEWDFDYEFTESGAFPVTLQLYDNVSRDDSTGEVNTCVTTLSRVVVIDQTFAPNVITPNGDGDNDMFRISARRPGTTISIFNRWGKRVAEVGATEEGWTPSEDMTDGIYYYIFEEADTQRTRKGWVEVRRK